MINIFKKYWHSRRYRIMSIVMKGSPEYYKGDIWSMKYSEFVTRKIIEFDIAELYKVRQKILDEVADCDPR